MPTRPHVAFGWFDKAVAALVWVEKNTTPHAHERPLSHIYHGSGMVLQFHKEFTRMAWGIGGSQSQIARLWVQK
ncbi:hypothetical protein CGRA01v4_05807 [Colletotrichum graminicola]|nr:hypothetical protein CGRA01v4_05807 [Colletotrichum graminicola]